MNNIENLFKELDYVSSDKHSFIGLYDQLVGEYTHLVNRTLDLSPMVERYFSLMDRYRVSEKTAVAHSFDISSVSCSLVNKIVRMSFDCANCKVSVSYSNGGHKIRISKGGLFTKTLVINLNELTAMVNPFVIKVGECPNIYMKDAIVGIVLNLNEIENLIKCFKRIYRAIELLTKNFDDVIGNELRTHILPNS